MEEIWSIEGGDVEREIKIANRHKKKEWQTTAHVTMILGKGSLQGADVMTPEVFAKVEPLYLRFFKLQVQTKAGHNFSTLDLCARGAMPDYPGNRDACAAWEASNRTDTAMQAACFPSPEFPCMVNSPFHCFSESAAHLPERYKALDAIADQVFPKELFAIPYATRPSYQELSHKEMKAEASKVRMSGKRGCDWWTGTTTFSPPLWGGHIEENANGTLIEKVKAIRWMFFYDAPRRTSFRMSLTKPQQANEAEIEEALRLHEEAWQSEVLAFAPSLADVEVLNVGPSLEEDLIEENNKPRWGLIILGGVFMWLFITVSLVSFHRPLESRMHLGQIGLNCIGISLFSSCGLWLLLGFKLNAVMITVLPFLALGLGVDDMFVLIRYFSELGEDFITENSYSDILGELLARGGAGATLTSICNTAAFGCAALLPVKALRDFCVAAGIISLTNYAVLFTQFLPLLVLEARRVKRREAEPNLLTYFCHRRALRRAPPTGRSVEESITTCLKDWYGPFLAWLPIRVGISVLACALVAISCVSIAVNTEIGFTVSELAPSGTHAARALEVAMDEFQTFLAQICFLELDVPRHQREMLKLYDDVTTSAHAVPFDLPPYLTMFSSFVLAQSHLPVPGLVNSTYASIGWTLDGSWTHADLAPFGTVNANPAKFYEAWGNWTAMPLDEPSRAFLPGGNAFLFADLVRTNEFKYESGPGSYLQFSFFPFYQTRLTTQDEYLNAIKEVRDVFEASPLTKEQAFPYGGIFSYWSIFIELGPILRQVFAIDLGVIFIVTLFVLRSGTSAFASTLACAMIVVLVYGACMLFARFNYFVAAGLLASAGISVEFTSHLVASFASLGGPLPERLGTAMAHTSPALFLGAVSTFLSLLPMAFNPLTYVVKYFFGMYAVCVGVGLLSGFLLLPGVLALISTVSDAMYDAVSAAIASSRLRPFDDGSEGRNLPTLVSVSANPAAEPSKKEGWAVSHP
jgi:predicted RND superfamily exporter protein